MAKRNTRSRRQAAQHALTRLLLAEVAEMISRPGPLAEALQARFVQSTATLESRDAVEHAAAGCKGTWVKSTPLSAAAPSSAPLFTPWVAPKSARRVAVKDLLSQELSLNEGELRAAYAQAAWRPARELQRDLRTAGALVARVFGESVGPYEPVDFLDGEPAPQSMDEAFVLLRRLAERSGLSPMGVLKAFVAGNLAATSLGDAFPGLRDAELVQRPASASIAIDVLPDGRVLMSSTCQGRPDSRYSPLDDEHAPQEVRRLLGELRERLALPPCAEAAHG